MADRTYSKAFEINRASPVFSYVEDSTLLGGSGAWRPLRASDFGGGGGGSTDMGPTILAIASGNANTDPASVSCSVNFTGSLLAKAAAGELVSIFGYCSGNAQYLRVYNGINESGSLVGVIAIPSANNFSVDFGAKGVDMSTGIFAALSSSPSSHVATGNDAIISIIWK